jgi:hypothetical protein
MGDLIERLRANALDECDEAIDRIEALEARVAAADKLAEACESAFDGIDATGPQEFYLALAAYQATKEQSK